MSVGGVVRQHNICHVILPLRGEPPHGEVSSDHNCPYASPGHTTVGSGLGRLGRGNALSWLSRSGPYQYSFAYCTSAFGCILDWLAVLPASESALLQCPESFLDWGCFNKGVTYFLCNPLLVYNDPYASMLPLPAHTQPQILHTSIFVGHWHSLKSQT